MAKGINGLSLLEFSVDGSTSWENLMGYAGNLRVQGGDMRTGEYYDFDNIRAQIIAGKFEPQNVQIRLLYSQGTTEPYAKLRAQYMARTEVSLRWAYGASTTDVFTSRGLMTSVPVPDSDAASADAIAVEIVQRTAGIVGPGES